MQILAGAITGSLGSLASNPIDVVKVGIMAEAGAFCKQTYTYTTGLRAGHTPAWSSTFDGLHSVCALGPSGIFRGAVPSVTRGAMMAAAQLSSYDHSKYVLREHFQWPEGPQLHVMSSLISGVCATFITSPADMLKTRIMGDHTHRYSGALDCLLQTVRKEGALAMWRGWFPAYLRLGPHFLITFPLYEHVRAAFGLGYL